MNIAFEAHEDVVSAKVDPRSVEEVIPGRSGDRLRLEYAILWPVYILRARLVPR